MTSRVLIRETSHFHFFHLPWYPFKHGTLVDACTSCSSQARGQSPIGTIWRGSGYNPQGLIGDFLVDCRRTSAPKALATERRSDVEREKFGPIWRAARRSRRQVTAAVRLRGKHHAAWRGRCALVPLWPRTLPSAMDRYLEMGSLRNPKIDSQPTLQADSHLGRAWARAPTGVNPNDDDDHPSIHARARVRGVLAKLGGQPPEDYRCRRRHQLLPASEYPREGW